MTERWIRTCQECGHKQQDKQPEYEKHVPDSYYRRKCKKCKSESLDWGKLVDKEMNLLKEKIIDMLHNARDNGPSDIEQMTAEELAGDLIAYGDFNPDETFEKILLAVKEIKNDEREI